MKSLLAWLGVSFLPALIGAPFPAPAWYRSLNRPRWSPPAWVFGPVWTFLYASMGVAAWLVWRRGGRRRVPLALFGVQLALNAAWTPLFFGARAIGPALAEIVATWVAVLATTVAFARQRSLAGALLLPYLAWVSFATALTASIWRRNR